MATVDERVQNGIDWLNKNEPDWLNHIDTEVLDIGNCYLCMMGQLFGSYFSKKRNNKITDDECCLSGFFIADDEYAEFGDEKYDELTFEWKRRIKELTR